MHGGGAAPVYAGGSGPGAPAAKVDAAVEEAAALVAALKVIEDDDVASRDPRSHTPHSPHLKVIEDDDVAPVPKTTVCMLSNIMYAAAAPDAKPASRTESCRLCRAPLAPLTAARHTLPRCRCYCTDDETADFFAELLGPRGGVAAIIANERGAEQGICPKLEKRGVVVLKLLDQTAAGKDDRQLVFLPPGSPTAFDGVPRPDGAPKVFPNQPYEERKTNWVTPQTPHPISPSTGTRSARPRRSTRPRSARPSRRRAPAAAAARRSRSRSPRSAPRGATTCARSRHEPPACDVSELYQTKDL